MTSPYKELSEQQLFDLITNKSEPKEHKKHRARVNRILTRLYYKEGKRGLQKCRTVFRWLRRDGYHFYRDDAASARLHDLKNLFSRKSYARWVGRMYGTDDLRTDVILSAVYRIESESIHQSLIAGIKEGKERSAETSLSLAFFLVSERELDAHAPDAESTYSYAMHVSRQTPCIAVSCGCQAGLTPAKISEFWMSGNAEDPKHRMETMLPILLGDLTAVRDDHTMPASIRRTAQGQLKVIFAMMSEKGVLIGPPKSQHVMNKWAHNWLSTPIYRRFERFTNLADPSWRVF